jgi:ubiquinone/menaquinone biosynthesis C-methylase UbiE
MQSDTNGKRDAKELAYLYDLYIVPQWREPFDQILDEGLKLPEEGKYLEVGCGTGGYAIDLAARAGAKTSVVGVDPNVERLALAKGKAEIRKEERVSFQQGSAVALDFRDGEFDLVIGDGSMLPPSQLGQAFAELLRVAADGATVAMKLATRGSFDEFFSIYWEALYDLGLTEYSPQLEGLITERLMVSDAEELAAAAGLKQIRCVTQKERFDFKDAATFLSSPLIETEFLDDWLAILPDDAARQRVRQQLLKIIDRERYNADFDVSIKATVVIGQK